MKCYRLLNLLKENNANPLPYIILHSVNCVVTTAMSNPGGGDSGSLLLDSDRKALGLFFGHTPRLIFLIIWKSLNRSFHQCWFSDLTELALKELKEIDIYHSISLTSLNSINCYKYTTSINLHSNSYLIWFLNFTTLFWTVHFSNHDIKAPHGNFWDMYLMLF